MKLGIFLSFVFLLSGCMVGPNYHRPKVNLPASYGATSSLQRVQQSVPAKWWTMFHSSALNQLIEASFKENPNMDAARESLHAAFEVMLAQQGALYPMIGLQAVPSKQQVAKLLTSILASNQYNFSLYTGSAFVTYTPDVFGGIRRNVQSLAAQAQLQRFQLEATYLTLASNVASAAINEASLQEQINLAKSMVRTQKQVTQIMRQQLLHGDVSISDLETQIETLSTNESNLVQLEAQLALQRDLLNSLVGRFSDDRRTPQVTLEMLHLPSKLPISLPSKLLEQRPDIRAAEANMQSANALIGVAVANRLPNVTIGFTNAGTSSTSLSTLFQGNTLFWSLAGIITQPIFDGNTLLHRQRYAEALYRQAVAQYRATIINAFQNVEDILKTIRFDAINFKIAHRAEQAAKHNFHIALKKRRLGDANTLDVLNKKMDYLQAKSKLTQIHVNRLLDSVALFQALGGGWRDKPCH